jgi:hypothetical protein
MPKTKAPALNGLSGSYRLTADIRKQCHIPNNVLTGEASRWKSIAFMITDYFSAPTKPSESASRTFSDFTSALKRIKELEATKKHHFPLKQFAAKIYTFLRYRQQGRV